MTNVIGEKGPLFVDRIHWRLLRPDTATTPDGIVPLSNRSRSVLIRLLLDAGRPVTSERIAEFVWGEDRPRTWQNSLARFVADLRRALGPLAERITTSPLGYRLDVRDGELDVDALRNILVEVEQLDAGSDSHVAEELRIDELLAYANELIGNDVNPALADQRDAAAVIAANQDLRLRVLELTAAVAIRRGEHTNALTTLRRAVDRHPYHEAFWGQLLVALQRTGRITEALRAYELAASTLAEVGLEPSAALRGLHAQLFSEEYGTNGRTAGAPASGDTSLDVAWGSLGPQLQTTLARLSVFDDGCTAVAAAAVVRRGMPIDADLTALTAKGLVRRSSVDTDIRYVVPGAVREFAAERLAERGETDVIRDRLVDWVRGLIEPWGVPELHAWAHASEPLVPELRNFAAALDHLAAQHRPDELVWLAVGACGMWLNHGHADEVVRWLEPFADDPFVSASARSAAFAMLMQAAHQRGDLAVLTHLGMASLELAGDEPHDWVPAVAGFLSLWGTVYPVPLDFDSLFSIASERASASRSAATNRALVAMYRGHVECGRLAHDEATRWFREALANTPHPGRLRLLGEIGEAVSLMLAGHTVEASRAVRAWWSKADTDDWHYVSDVVRAIVTGVAGDPELGTAELAAAARRLPHAGLWGRADDFQAAFGLLAGLRGEADLEAALLAAPVPRHLLLFAVVTDHVARSRGRNDPSGYLDVAIELWTRTFPQGVDRGSATTVTELIQWWTTGRAGPAALPPVSAG